MALFYRLDVVAMKQPGPAGGVPKLLPLSRHCPYEWSFQLFNRIMNVMDGELTIVFEPAEEGGYTAFIPEVPGAISEGETVEEAREMVLDALRELTAYRREQALRTKSALALVERMAASF